MAYVDPYIDGKTEVVTETGTKVEIALLAMLKWYIGITTNTEDTHLLILLGASRLIVEKKSGQYYQPRQVSLYAQEWVGRHDLPYGPFTGNLTSFTNDGVTVTNEEWVLKGSGHRTLFAQTGNGLALSYTTSGQALSDLAKMIILKYALTFYEARMNVVIGSISGRIPGNSDDMCRLLRSEA